MAKSSGSAPLFQRTLSPRQQELLSQFRFDGQRAVFTGQQIPDWAVIKQAFELLGAKWKTGSKNSPGAFVFPDDVDAAGVVAEARASGTVIDPKMAGFFPTPPKLADRLVELLDARSEHLVLEPSAGNGALIKALRRQLPGQLVSAFEALPANRQALRELAGVELLGEDFLQVKPSPRFHRVLMNPPFERQADLVHVQRAYSWLQPGGRLVAIMSASIEWRENQAAVNFREWLIGEAKGRLLPVEPGAFKASGTSVSTVIAVCTKGRAS